MIPTDKGWPKPALFVVWRFLMKIFISFFVALTLAASAHAVQLRQHEILISSSSTVEIPLTNNQENPILVHVTPPDGVQAFLRRIRLFPGERQVIKARMIGNLSENSRMAFSYAVERRQERGSHARITLRIPIREVR